MPLEIATYVNELVSTNPAAPDQTSQGDDHIRLLKSTLLTTFANLNGAVTATPTELNQLATGTRTIGLANGAATTPSLYLDSEATLGLYRASAGHLNVSQGKRLGGNGTVPVGAMIPFAKAPANFSSGGTAGSNTEWLECDGSVYNFSDFPDLGAFMLATYGGNGTTTFGVPDLSTTNKFLRARGGSLTVGTAQSNVIKTHTSTAVVTEPSAGAHTHTVNITDPGHAHLYDFKLGPGSAGSFEEVRNANTEASTYSTRAATTGITAATVSDGAHTHGTTVAVTYTGSTETRPEAFAAIYCVKT